MTTTKVPHVDSPPSKRGRIDRLMDRYSHRSLPKKLLMLGTFFVILQCAFLLINTVAAAIPDGRIIEAIITGKDEHTLAFVGGDRLGGIPNTFTDCVEIGTGLGESSRNPLHKAVLAPVPWGCEELKKKAAVWNKDHQPIEYKTSPYFRYWTGYTIITKPLTWLYGIGALRLISGLLLFTSIAAFIIFVGKLRKNYWIPTALVAPMLLTSNIVAMPTATFSHTLSYATFFGGLCLTAWATRRYGINGAVWSAVFTGAVFNFIDLLTTPAVPWIWTAFIAAAMLYNKDTKALSVFKTALITGVAWFAGFALTWASRWIIASIILGPSYVLPNIYDQFFVRIDGDNVSYQRGFGNAIKATWEYWTQHLPFAWTVLFGSAIIFVILCILIARRSGWKALVSIAAFSAICLIVPVWIEIMSNHSQVHRHFVYRNYPAAVGLLLASAVVVFTVTSRKNKANEVQPVTPPTETVSA